MREFKYSTFCTLHEKEISRHLSFAIIINSHPEAWIAGNAILHFEEQKQLKRMVTNPAKNSFCHGRIASRLALQKLSGQEDVQSWIDHGIFGFPVLEPNPNGYGMTLAHTETAGFAACFDERDMIGVDIETIDSSKDAIIESALTIHELNLANSNKSEKSKILHLIWSAREALSKAIKTGFLIPLHLLAVKAIEEKDNSYHISFDHFSLFEVIAFTMDSNLCAIALPERSQLEMTPILEMKRQYEKEQL